MQHVASSFIVSVAHHRDVLITVFESIHSRVLARRRRAHDGKLVDLRHLGNDLLRSARIAESPAGHGVALGKSVDQDRALAHAGQRCDGHMLRTVGKFAVDLIRDNDDILLDAHLRDGLEVFLRHDGAGRIVREREHEKFRLLGDRVAKFLRRQAEFIFLLKRDLHRHALCQDDARLVTHVARLRDDDLIARADHGADCKIDRLAAAHRHEDLSLRLIQNAVVPVYIRTDLVAQLHKTRVRRIVRARFLEGVDALLADVPRRRKIRFADTQTDGALHLRDDVEKFADARGFDPLNSRI